MSRLVKRFVSIVGLASLAALLVVAPAAAQSAYSSGYGGSSYGGSSRSDGYGSKGGGSGYGSGSYGSRSYDSGRYGSKSYGSKSYGSGSYGSKSYGSGSYGSGSYGPGSYGSKSYGSGSYDSYGPGSYGYCPMQYDDGNSEYGDNYGSSGESYSQGQVISYRVVFGDTLNKIAARFGSTVLAILRANPSIRNPDLIYAGRKLLIPTCAAAPYAGSNAAPSYGQPSAPSGGYEVPSVPSNEYAAPAAPPSTMPMPPAAPAPAPAPQPGGGQSTGQTVTINLSARNMAFSMSSITVPAGAHVVIQFSNQDAMPHSFAVYMDSSAQQAIFQGEVVMGPNATMTYRFDAPAQPGTYFFRCDVHPTQMTGKFIVR